MTWNTETQVNNVAPAGETQMDRIKEAVEVLEENIDDNTLFLWTGGKDAQVIANLLLYAVGDEKGKSPVPFGIIDTGNQFEQIYEFRKQYLAPTPDVGASTIGPFEGVEEFHVEKFDELLEKVILNEDDPRGFHGQWDDDVELPPEEELEGIAQQNTTKEEWDVAASCGALKTIPIKRFVDDHGYDKLITGRRSDDFIVQKEEDEEGGSLEHVEETDQPVPHTRINPLSGWDEANVWAYLKHESVSYPVLYDQGFRHTDSVCCTQDVSQQAGEYGEGGIDPEKEQAKDQLQEMGYI